MTRSASLFICLLFLALLSPGQQISRQYADSMQIAMNKTNNSVDRMKLLLNLAQFHIFKSGENKIDLDSAASYINQAKVLSMAIHSPEASAYLLLIESYLVKESGPKLTIPPYFRSAESKKMVEKSIEILRSTGNNNYLGQAYYELSQYYDDYDSLQALKKIELLGQSVNAFQHAGDPERKGRSLEMLGDLYFIWNEQDKSTQTLKDALTAYNSINYPKLQGIYGMIGRSWYYKHDRALALTNLLKALRIAQSLGDSSAQMFRINYYLGLFYSDIDRLDMAVKYLNDAMGIGRKYNDESCIFSSVISLSYGYNNNGQPGQSLKILASVPKRCMSSADLNFKLPVNLAYFRAYLGLLQLNKALPYRDVLIRTADHELNPHDYNMRSLIYMSVANFDFLSGLYGNARYYLAKSNDIANKLNYDFVQLHNLELAYKLDSAEGNLKSAFNHLLKYKEKTDAVSSERKIRQFQVMNIEYAMEMKEDSIILKNRDIISLIQQNKLQQENLKQAGLIKNISVAGIILAFIVIVLLSRQYRHKQKNNKTITQKNEQLQHLNEQQIKLLTEKDWLVKEIHHRVKNNLQMVVSLLNAQSEFLTHPSAINAIVESRERMQAIAIIHQKLYQMDNSTVVNMRIYVNELVDNIKNSFINSERIRFNLAINDIDLDISQLVPLGLIMNEAITNAVKYAFPKNKNGLIQISLKYSGKERLQLNIADNGKGLPADIDFKQSNSLGMKLIRLFAEQLDGDLYFVNNNGLEIILNFKTADYQHAAVHKITA